VVDIDRNQGGIGRVAAGGGTSTEDGKCMEGQTGIVFR
jgi:hypothetical protein